MEDINRVSDEELEGVSGGSAGQRFIQYTVVKGDTLTRIALR